MQELQKVEGLSVDELEAQTIELLPERVEMKWRSTSIKQKGVFIGNEQENEVDAFVARDVNQANLLGNFAAGDDFTFRQQ